MKYFGLYVDWMLLVGTNSNCGESTQVLPKKTQIKTSRGEGEFGCFSAHKSFYNLFPCVVLYVE